ncbi:MAG TPA: thiamine pyrophosphate-binding protein [Terriglobales bacterium]|nr:thiamine pyrophosphate-binding protein [Terriglobales bacterium]
MILCTALEKLGVKHVFGLPGSQNVLFFEALRQSSIRTILATHELAAAFMANGYYRASGTPGVLTTIPGPGFAYTVAAIAEASQDSSALLYIASQPVEDSNKKFHRQSVDQRALLAPMVRRVVEVDRGVDIQNAVREAYAATTAGEPGPVLLLVKNRAIWEEAEFTANENIQNRSLPSLDPAAIKEVVQALEKSRRVVLFVGQGVSESAGQLRKLIELVHASVITTRSGRGVIPEDHPQVLRFVYSEPALHALNSVFERSDLILAIGCKFSQNGTHGFQLRIPESKLIHVDASTEVLNANYPARLAIHSNAGIFLDQLLGSLTAVALPHSEWTAEELSAYKKSGADYANEPEPKVNGVNPSTPAGFFTALRKAMPPDACLVTDSGLHQVLSSRHFRVQSPRGIVSPSDFQSMGFGLPSAIGAKLSCPNRKIVAIIGDGGFAITGMEIVTAVREQIPLTIIVFNDGALGQIRLQQISRFGHTHATNLQTPNLELFAQAVGANYAYLDGDAESVLRAAMESNSVTLVEVNVGDSNSIRAERIKALTRETSRKILKHSKLGWIKSRLRQ